MSNRTASRHGVTIVAGNIVRIADGRTGVVEEVIGSEIVVEVPAARTSRTQVLTADSLFDYVTVEAIEVAHAA